MANLTRSVEEFKTALLGQLEKTSAALEHAKVALDNAIQKSNEKSAYLAVQAKQGIKFQSSQPSQSDEQTFTPTRKVK